MASQITSITNVYSAVYSDADKKNHQSSASLAFVRGIHRWPMISPHKWPVTWKMFLFNDVIMLAPNMVSKQSVDLLPPKKLQHDFHTCSGVLRLPLSRYTCYDFGWYLTGKVNEHVHLIPHSVTGINWHIFTVYDYPRCWMIIVMHGKDIEWEVEQFRL